MVRNAAQILTSRLLLFVVSMLIMWLEIYFFRKIFRTPFWGIPSSQAAALVDFSVNFEQNIASPSPLFAWPVAAFLFTQTTSFLNLMKPLQNALVAASATKNKPWRVLLKPDCLGLSLCCRCGYWLDITAFVLIGLSPVILDKSRTRALHSRIYTVVAS
ncbi:hypothetical protein TNCV_1429411 [Trichonephila clavipes]|nr:hypothetical protein TNCV_1429411 [Trichonephila clavipes]